MKIVRRVRRIASVRRGSLARPQGHVPRSRRVATELAMLRGARTAQAAPRIVRVLRGNLAKTTLVLLFSVAATGLAKARSVRTAQAVHRIASAPLVNNAKITYVRRLARVAMGLVMLERGKIARLVQRIVAARQVKIA